MSLGVGCGAVTKSGEAGSRPFRWLMRTYKPERLGPKPGTPTTLLHA